MVCLDDPNESGLVKAEAVVRKLVQVATAVWRNPKQPDIEMLDLLEMQVASETGDFMTHGFST